MKTQPGEGQWVVKKTQGGLTLFNPDGDTACTAPLTRAGSRLLSAHAFDNGATSVRYVYDLVLTYAYDLVLTER